MSKGVVLAVDPLYVVTVCSTGNWLAKTLDEYGVGVSGTGR